MAVWACGVAAAARAAATNLLTVGAESCDAMLKGLEGLDDSRTIETVETKELMRNLAALRET